MLLWAVPPSLLGYGHIRLPRGGRFILDCVLLRDWNHLRELEVCGIPIGVGVIPKRFCDVR